MKMIKWNKIDWNDDNTLPQERIDRVLVYMNFGGAMVVPYSSQYMLFNATDDNYDYSFKNEEVTHWAYINHPEDEEMGKRR